MERDFKIMTKIHIGERGMFRGRKKGVISRVFLSLFLVSSCALTGCSQTPVMLGYDRSRMELGEFSDFKEDADVSLMGDDVCVITKNKAKDSDPDITADSAMLICLNGQQESQNTEKQEKVFASNVFKKIYPASVTKIVTAYVALKYGNMDDEVTISHNAANIDEPQAKKCGFNEGDKLTLRVLLNSFLVYSGNDAGIAIAEHISGSVDEFSGLMNKEMKLLGGTGSNFVNPHGLHDDSHYTTCYDIYLVFKELIKNDDFLGIVGQGSYTANFEGADGVEKSLTFTSTNRYLTNGAAVPEGVTVFGGKTGTTNEAGSCLVLYFNKDRKDYLGFIFKAEDGDSCYYQMTHLINLGGEV